MDSAPGRRGVFIVIAGGSRNVVDRTRSAGAGRAGRIRETYMVSSVWQRGRRQITGDHVESSAGTLNTEHKRMSITIHPELEARLRARAEAEGISVEAYVERIARADEAAEQELEALALEGFNSGDSIVADDKYWADKRARLIERHRKTGAW